MLEQENGNSKLKRICFIMPGHWTYNLGGAEYQVKCIMDVLIRENNYDIYFITRNVDPSYIPVGYKIVLIKNHFWSIRANYLFDGPALFRALNIVQPDIIYQRRGLTYTGFSANYAQKHHCKFIWHIAHDDDVTSRPVTISFNGLKQYIVKKIIEYGILKSENIIAQTADQASYLEQFYGKTPSVIMNNFHPLPVMPLSKSTPFNVVWVANLKPIKQPEVFLQMAEDLSNKTNIRFTMIGKLPAGHWGEQIAKIIKQTNSVNFLGAISQDEVNEVLADASILVNTSQREGFSNTFIQAWMRKVPVISLCVNPDRIFDNEQVGFCSKSYEQLIKDVSKLLDNPDLRERMGCTAQQYAYNNFSEIEVQKLINLIT